MPNQLNRHQMAILREMYLLREQLAESRDLPPFKVFPDKTLIQVALAEPRRMGDLNDIDGMTPAQIRRYGKQVLKAVERSNKDRLPEPPVRQPAAEPDIVECYTLLREWRKQRAQERGVESDVIVSREALWTLAHRHPTTLEAMADIQGLGPWRLATYGEDLLAVLKKCNGNGNGKH
jgi:ribonuclease D